MTYNYKSIKFDPADHQIIVDLAAVLKEERGGRVYLPGAVLEAVKFYREYRHTVVGTPGGQAQTKGVITE